MTAATKAAAAAELRRMEAEAAKKQQTRRGGGGGLATKSIGASSTERTVAGAGDRPAEVWEKAPRLSVSGAGGEPHRHRLPGSSSLPQNAALPVPPADEDDDARSIAAKYNGAEKDEAAALTEALRISRLEAVATAAAEAAVCAAKVAVDAAAEAASKAAEAEAAFKAARAASTDTTGDGGAGIAREAAIEGGGDAADGKGVSRRVRDSADEMHTTDGVDSSGSGWTDSGVSDHEHHRSKAVRANGSRGGRMSRLAKTGEGGGGDDRSGHRFERVGEGAKERRDRLAEFPALAPPPSKQPRASTMSVFEKKDNAAVGASSSPKKSGGGAGTKLRADAASFVFVRRGK